MKKTIALISLLLLLVATWFLVWRSIMAPQVAQVRASIDHHYRAIKTQSPTVTLKADEVYATGFPFGFRVAVARPTLTQIWGRESYAVSLPLVVLERTDAAQGRYRAQLPATFDAMYAVEGSAPEHYEITLNAVPAVLLRAQGDSRQCPNLPGARPCAAVADEAPLISFAAQLPRQLVLDVAMGGKSEKIGFTLTPLPVPVFLPIPATAAQPLQTFVGMLREALVFGTGR
jgi:hypothetical protein